MELKEILKQHRKIRKITQKELAIKTGISQQSISAYENGTIEPTISKCITLANFYNISLDELVDREFF